MLKFARFLKQFKREVLIGPVFKLTEAVFELIVPLVMAQIIDVGIANGDRGYVLRMGGVMVLLGLVGAVLGQLGDLSFSAIKRECGVKDYGRLLPGHGGVLDRFDSVIFASPVVWLLIKSITLY